MITAVYNGGHQYLMDAYKSLCNQQLPEEWTWQWCVQEDGDSGIATEVLPHDPRISFGTGLRARTAVTRTHALTRAAGELIRTLDADDMLMPGGLERDIEALQRVPWCVSACIDLHEDGSTSPGPCDPPNGPLAPMRFYQEQLDSRLSVQAVTFAARRPLVLALGGWQALSGAETVGLLLSAEAVAPGEFVAEQSLMYRQHAGQTTASKRYWEPTEAAARMAAVIQRAQSLREAGWTWLGHRTV